MVKVILGLKGSGKTKQLIQAVNDTVKEDKGSVVCIEKGDALKYDISSRCRLIDAGEYQLYGYTFLKGFICGLHAGNFDITNIFIDSFYKIIAEPSEEKTQDFLAWCDTFSKVNDINFTISMSREAETVPQWLAQYI